MLAAEGAVHKRQRRVATPGFSIQNLRALVPLVFRKGEELKDKWMCMIEDAVPEHGTKSVRLDVAHWISRATFDVIGLAGVSIIPFSLMIECDDEPLVLQDLITSSMQSRMNRTNFFMPTRRCLKLPSPEVGTSGR
jgi:hypothetical protein